MGFLNAATGENPSSDINEQWLSHIAQKAGNYSRNGRDERMNKSRPLSFPSTFPSPPPFIVSYPWRSKSPGKTGPFPVPCLKLRTLCAGSRKATGFYSERIRRLDAFPAAAKAYLYTYVQRPIHLPPRTDYPARAIVSDEAEAEAEVCPFPSPLQLQPIIAPPPHSPSPDRPR